jgi:hypothetical protein
MSFSVLLEAHDRSGKKSEEGVKMRKWCEHCRERHRPRRLIRHWSSPFAPERPDARRTSRKLLQISRAVRAGGYARTRAGRARRRHGGDMPPAAVRRDRRVATAYASTGTVLPFSVFREIPFCPDGGGRGHRPKTGRRNTETHSPWEIGGTRQFPYLRGFRITQVGRRGGGGGGGLRSPPRK